MKAGCQRNVLIVVIGRLARWLGREDAKIAVRSRLDGDGRRGRATAGSNCRNVPSSPSCLASEIHRCQDRRGIGGRGQRHADVFLSVPWCAARSWLGMSGVEPPICTDSLTGRHRYRGRLRVRSASAARAHRAQDSVRQWPALGSLAQSLVASGRLVSPHMREPECREPETQTVVICFDAWLLLPIAQVGGFAVLCTEAAAGSCLPALEWNTWNTLSVADGNRLSVRNGRKTGYAGYLYSGGMQGGALRVG